jgi:DinB family protein
MVHSAAVRPEPAEAAPYYFRYINQVRDDDVVATLRKQLRECPEVFSKVAEERSLYRPAPGKWNIREILNHVSDAERVFAFRALWFARGLDASLPSFEQTVAAASAGADGIPLAKHLDEFKSVRASTLTLFESLSNEAWLRGGIASDSVFTVRAIAFIIAGHFAHHMAIISDEYL